MKRLLPILIFIFFAAAWWPSGNAGPSEGRYNSHITTEGTLYFLNPKKLGVCRGISRFQYDVTLLTWNDTATVNFTFRTPDISAPKDLTVSSGTSVFTCTDWRTLFVDLAGKNKYDIRITAKFPVKDIVELLSAPTPPVFRFVQGGTHCEATYSPGAWSKDRPQLQRIINLYQHTK